MDYLAKDYGLTLKQHSIDVVNKVVEILNQSGITDEKIIRLSKIAAATHDCGKTMSCFQNYLATKDKSNIDYPMHNEIGFSLLELLIDENFGFLDKEEIKLVRYSTLFHHTLYQKNKSLSEVYDIDELNDIADYYNDIFKCCGIDDNIRFRNNISEEEFDDCDICSANTFDFIETDGKLTNTMVKLKTFEIIFNVVRYADIVVSNIDSEIKTDMIKFNKELTYNDFVKPSHFDSARWNEQRLASEEAYNANNCCIISATMGWGKTVCGIDYFLHSNKRGFWVCPDNGLATATYNSIVSTINECGIGNLRIALLLSGCWVKNNWDGEYIDVDDADIIVTNIDTYVNGIFRNSRKRISCETLFSNCIFDEFHEYAFMDVPLLARFKTVVESRKYMNNVKTLFLSGTNINDGYVKINDVFEKGINLEENKLVRIHFLTKKEYDEGFSKLEDSVVINTRIKSCQNIYTINNMDFCYHSEFDDNDSYDIVNEIMAHNGKYATENKATVSSTSIFSRGMDVSFTNCFVINPNPLMIEQITGRSNRWGKDEIGNIYIVLDEDRNELAIYKNLWKDYYYPYIQYLKENIENGEIISIKKLKDFRVNFFEKNSNKNLLFKKLIKDNLKNSIQELKKIEFTKGSNIGDKKDNAKHIKDAIDVRGNNLTRFFTIQIKDAPFGVMSNAINLPHYRFGENFENLRNNPTIIQNVIKYFKAHEDIAQKYDIRRIKSFQPHNLFKLLMDKSKCSETPFPLLCDYEYTKKLGFYKKN